MGIRGTPNPTAFTEAIKDRRERVLKQSRRVFAPRVGLSESTYQMMELGYASIADYADAIFDAMCEGDAAEKERLSALQLDYEKPEPTADELIAAIVNRLNTDLPTGTKPYPVLPFSMLIRAQREERGIFLDETKHRSKFSHAENDVYSGGTKSGVANTLIGCIVDVNRNPVFPDGLNAEFYTSTLGVVQRHERRAREFPDALWAWRSWGGTMRGSHWQPRMGRVPLAKEFGVSEMTMRGMESKGQLPTAQWVEDICGYFSTSLGLGEFTLPHGIDITSPPMDEDMFLRVGVELAKRLRDMGAERTQEAPRHPQAIDFGLKVKALRDILGIGQLDLGRLLPDAAGTNDPLIRARVSNIELGNFKNPIGADEMRAFHQAFGLTEPEFNTLGIAAIKVVQMRDRCFTPAVNILMNNTHITQRTVTKETGINRGTLQHLLTPARHSCKLHTAHMEHMVNALQELNDSLADTKYHQTTPEVAIYAEAGYLRIGANGDIDPASAPYSYQDMDSPYSTEDFTSVGGFRTGFIQQHAELFNPDGSVLQNNGGSGKQYTRSRRSRATANHR